MNLSQSNYHIERWREECPPGVERRFFQLPTLLFSLTRWHKLTYPARTQNAATWRMLSPEGMCETDKAHNDTNDTKYKRKEGAIFSTSTDATRLLQLVLIQFFFNTAF
jgi:hypothetical protein